MLNSIRHACVTDRTINGRQLSNDIHFTKYTNVINKEVSEDEILMRYDSTVIKTVLYILRATMQVKYRYEII